MAKNITVYETEAQQIKIKATYEGKDATDLVTLDTVTSNVKGLGTLGTLSKGILPFTAGTTINQDNCSLVYKYPTPKTTGEAKSFSTQAVNINVIPTVLQLVSAPNTLFPWIDGTTPVVNVTLTKNGKSILLTDPGLVITPVNAYATSTSKTDTALTLALSNPNDGTIGLDLAPVIQNFKFTWQHGSFVLPVTFNQRKTINVTQTAVSSALSFASVLPANWFTAKFKDGTDALPTLVSAVPTLDSYFRQNADKTLTVINDEYRNDVTGNIPWVLSFTYNGLTWTYPFTMPYKISKSFGVGTLPTTISGKVGDKGTLVFPTTYRGAVDASHYTLLASTLNTGSGILKFGDIVRTDNKVGLPYEILKWGNYTFNPAIGALLGTDLAALATAGITVTAETNITSLSGALGSASIKVGTGGAGSMQFSLKDNFGNPVVGATFSNVTSTASVLGVLNIGTNVPVASGAAGNYVLNYATSSIGWIILKMNVLYQGKTFVVTLPTLTITLL